MTGKAQFLPILPAGDLSAWLTNQISNDEAGRSGVTPPTIDNHGRRFQIPSSSKLDEPHNLVLISWTILRL